MRIGSSPAHLVRRSTIDLAGALVDARAITADR